MMDRRLFSKLARFLRFAPDNAPSDEPSVLRSARHNAPIAWMRVPIVLVISLWILVFVGPWAWVAWTAVTLLVERLATYCRTRLITGDLRWARPHLITLVALSLCWVTMSGLVWHSGNEVARIAAIMGLLTLAIYGAIGGYKDLSVLLSLMVLPLLALPVMMGVDLWTHETPEIALLGSVSTGATAAIVAVLGIGLHRSDSAGQKARQELAASLDALKETRSIVEDATSAANVGWWRFDARTIKMHWSESMRRIFGVGPDYEPTGQWAPDFYTPDVAEEVQRQMAEGISTGEGWRIVAPLTTLDGRKIWIRGTATVVKEDGIVMSIIGIVQDITREKELQDELIEAQKFEAVGRVTSRIAHNLNNTLTAIASAANALERNDLEAARREAHLKSIRDATARAGEIYNNLNSYARMQVLDPRPASINDVAMEVTRLLHVRFGDTVQICCNLAPETPFVRVDIELLMTSLMHLGTNACEAMAGRGVLTLSTRIAPALTPAEDGASPMMVMIDIIDTGPGIPASIRDKLFDPFFTTSQETDRTGLGLSIAHGFARQSGGALTLHNSDTGAHFCMSFPLVAREGQCPSPPGRRHGAARTVLLVEDHEIVRVALTFALEDAGYAVLAVASGEEALEALADNRPFDVVLADVVLSGGISGPEAVSHIRKKRPDAQIVFMSGYAEDKLGDVHAMGAHYLRKPFVIEDLSKLIGAPKIDA